MDDLLSLYLSALNPLEILHFQEVLLTKRQSATTRYAQGNRFLVHLHGQYKLQQYMEQQCPFTNYQDSYYFLTKI